MGLDDKIDNALDKAKSKAKQGYGTATDDPGMEAEAKAEQKSADLKQAGEKVKDVFSD